MGADSSSSAGLYQIQSFVGSYGYFGSSVSERVKSCIRECPSTNKTGPRNFPENVRVFSR